MLHVRRGLGEWTDCSEMDQPIFVRRQKLQRQAHVHCHYMLNIVQLKKQIKQNPDQTSQELAHSLEYLTKSSNHIFIILGWHGNSTSGFFMFCPMETNSNDLTSACTTTRLCYWIKYWNVTTNGSCMITGRKNIGRLLVQFHWLPNWMLIKKKIMLCVWWTIMV